MTVHCLHKNTRYLEEEWPTGETIEVCSDCGMSRAHWEQGESNWIMVENIPLARKQLQDAIDRMMEKFYDRLSE